MSRTLSEHAAYELTKAGLTDNEDPEARKVARDVLGLVKRFEKQKHNDKTGPFVLEAFETLATRLPLTPITDDPEEWDKYEIDRKNVDSGEVEKKVVWQSKRAPSLMSEDEGKTFTDQRTGKTGQSVDHVKQAEEKAAAEKARQERKAAAEARAANPNPVGTVNPDVPAGEASADAPAEEESTVATTPEDEAGKAEEAKAVEDKKAK